MRNIRTSNNTISTIKRGETLNPENRRLKEIQTHKQFYHQRLKEAKTELETDLLEIQLDKLNKEETDILKRCKAI